MSSASASRRGQHPGPGHHALAAQQRGHADDAGQVALDLALGHERAAAAARHPADHAAFLQHRERLAQRGPADPELGRERPLGAEPLPRAQPAAADLLGQRAPDLLGGPRPGTSVMQVPSVRHQQVAYTSFFAKRARYPRYKSRTGRQSAEYTRSGFRYRDGQLFLAKMDTPLVFVWSWPDIHPAAIGPSTVTVSRDPCGRWYVSFAVEVADPEQLPTAGHAVGVDLGIKDFAVTSDGRRSLTRTAWLAGNGTSPATSAGWPGASAGPRTAPRPRRRSPAPTGKSALIP